MRGLGDDKSDATRVQLDTRGWQRLTEEEACGRLEAFTRAGGREVLTSLEAPIRGDNAIPNPAPGWIAAYTKVHPDADLALWWELTPGSPRSFGSLLAEILLRSGGQAPPSLVLSDARAGWPQLRAALSALETPRLALRATRIETTREFALWSRRARVSRLHLPADPLSLRDPGWRGVMEQAPAGLELVGEHPLREQTWMGRLRAGSQRALAEAAAAFHRLCLEEPACLGEPPVGVTRSLPRLLHRVQLEPMPSCAPACVGQSWAGITDLLRGDGGDFGLGWALADALLQPGGHAPACLIAPPTPATQTCPRARWLRSRLGGIVASPPPRLPRSRAGGDLLSAPVQEQAADPDAALARAIARLGGWRSLLGEPATVVIKPNLVTAAPPPTTSATDLLAALLASLREAGYDDLVVADLGVLRAAADMVTVGKRLGLPTLCARYGARWEPVQSPWDGVRVHIPGEGIEGHGPRFGHSASTMTPASLSGFSGGLSAPHRMPPPRPLSRPENEVSFNAGVLVAGRILGHGHIEHLEVLRRFHEAPRLINLAALKQHRLAGWTGACKNLVGAMGWRTRLQLHELYDPEDPRAFLGGVARIAAAVPAELHLLDARVVAADDHLWGRPRWIGELVAGRDPYEVDRLGLALLCRALPGFAAPGAEALRAVTG